MRKRHYFIRRRNRFKPLWVSLLILAMIVGGLWLLAARLVFQVTGSLPKGLYLISEAAAIEKGDLVLLDVPQRVRAMARRRGWIPAGLHYLLMKPVAATAGDRVKVSAFGVFINGEYFGSVRQHDAQGLPLPAATGVFDLGAGEFFLASPDPRSFDSRYFGPVRRGQIRAVARPLAVFGGGK